ncbi:hypothetical protein, partial [Prevotella sp.]|uniref:hypothetical protein n=1 Tax=Prevotella sp. TaxID=59823 RepID=UPI003AF5078F
MGYRIMFLVSQLTAELWNACMSITFSGMGYEMVNQIIVVENVHHANIVQVVKMRYKIKINSRESKSCFYGVLLCKQHPSCKRIRDAAFFLIIMLVTFAATLLKPQNYVSSRTIQKCVE